MRTFFIALLIPMSVFASPKVSVDVELNPAGSFQAITHDLKGKITKQGETLKADKISIPVKTLQTGIDLRDEHLWKHLSVSKYPSVTLSNVKGEKGKANGILEIAGIKKNISIDYKEKGNEVLASFKINTHDFKLPKAEYLNVGVEEIITCEVTMPINQ
ncbi:MAG: YceI family protein [Bacteriovoracaceae bacterium]